MTGDEREMLVKDYLAYLSWGRLHARMPATRGEAKSMVQEIGTRARANPYWHAWERLEELIDSDPETAWPVALDILRRCEEMNLSSLGTGPLETLIWRHPGIFEDRFEQQIVSNVRFRNAFKFVCMGGVPLVVQRKLNAALVHMGVDPATLVEFDEDISDEP